MSLENSGLTQEGLAEIFHAQILSRHLDLASRKLSKAGQGFYTIGSSGHEGNAAVTAGRPFKLLARGKYQGKRRFGIYY